MIYRLFLTSNKSDLTWSAVYKHTGNMYNHITKKLESQQSGSWVHLSAEWVSGFHTTANTPASAALTVHTHTFWWTQTRLNYRWLVLTSGSQPEAVGVRVNACFHLGQQHSDRRVSLRELFVLLLFLLVAQVTRERQQQRNQGGAGGDGSQQLQECTVQRHMARHIQHCTHPPTHT